MTEPANNRPFARFMQRLTDQRLQTSIVELARRLKLDQPAVSNLYNGKADPTERVLRAFKENLPEYYGAALTAAAKQRGVAIILDIDPSENQKLVLATLLSLVWSDLTETEAETIRKTILELRRQGG